MGVPVPSTGTVTEDVGVVGSNISTSGDVNYAWGDDSGDWSAGTQTGSYGDLAIDSDGVWSYVADNSQPAIQNLNTGESLTEVFTVSAVNGDTTVTITIQGTDEPPCFTRGTPIETPQGPRMVEDLRVGDAVLTADNGVQIIRWAGSRRLDLGPSERDAKLHPVRLRKDSIASGVPDRDLLVSPMHRVLLDGARAQLAFGQPEVFCAARHLVNGRTILSEPVAEIEYFHLMFDQHQILTSHNCRSESFYPGTVGLDRFDLAMREEVLALFPELRSVAGAYGATARTVLKRHEAMLIRADLTPPAQLRNSLVRRAA